MTRESHGMNKSPEHRAWVDMKQRCTNPKKRDFKHYGGRGIKVCYEWARSFVAFYAHIGPRPTPNHSLDRIDVQRGYEPGNVRWATHQQQVENTRVVRMVTLGSRTQSISAWEREKGLPRGMVRSREMRGWSIEAAICTPSVKGQKLVSRAARDYSKQTRGDNGRYATD